MKNQTGSVGGGQNQHRGEGKGRGLERELRQKGERPHHGIEQGSIGLKPKFTMWPGSK